MLLVAGRQASFFIVLLFISQLFRDNASQQCVAGGDLYSIYQMMLKGHTYKSFKTAPGTLELGTLVVTHDRCHEGTEKTLVFHSVEIPLPQKQGTHSPFDHGC